MAMAGPDQAFARFVGTEDGDTYLGTKRDDQIFGYGGNDTLAGGDGNDTIDGGSGNDTLAGERGDDVVTGGDGDDIISSSDGADAINGGDGVDQWLGRFGAAATSLVFDEAKGTLSNGTTIVGIESIDLTFGAADDAALLSGRTNTIVRGGKGNDEFTLDVGGSGARAKIVGEFTNHGDLSISISSRVDGALKDARITADGFETWSFAGTDAGDLLNFEGPHRGAFVPVAITIDARGGNDRISILGDGNTIDGGDGNDQIVTTCNGQTIDGGSGYDIWTTAVRGGVTYDQANQTLSSGTTLIGIEQVRLTSQYFEADTPGNVFNLSTRGAIYLYEEGGNDRIHVNFSALTENVRFEGITDSLTGVWTLSFGQAVIFDSTPHDEPFITLVGTQGSDEFVFNSPAFYTPRLISEVKSIDGGAGIDGLTAGLGSNVTFQVSPDGTITSNVGSFSNLEQFDLIVGAGDNVVTTGAFDDRIVVYATATGANTLSGGAGNDTISGAKGGDRLNGNGGDDTLTGNEGADVMNGGAGADTFVFVNLADFGTASRDRILDFSHAQGDKIDLSAIDPKRGGYDQAFTFIGTGAFTGAASAFELRAEDQGDGTFLVQGDVNHDRVADFVFVVTSTAPLVAGDFAL